MVKNRDLNGFFRYKTTHSTGQSCSFSVLPNHIRPAVNTNRSAFVVRIFLLGVVLLTSVFTTRAQNFALKSNLLYDATATINLGTEFRIAKRQTIDISWNLNPWEFGKMPPSSKGVPGVTKQNHRKMKHWMIQPEWRYWFCQPFSRSFIGIEAHAGQFNFTGMLPFGFSDGSFFGVRSSTLEKYRYEGWAYGLGVTYGYQWILSNHWNFEASLGIGLTHLNYDRADCDKCGENLGKGKPNFFGPTKAALSIIYIIK